MTSILGSSKKIMPGPTNKSNAIYDNGTAQQQNQYEAGKTDTGILAAATGMSSIKQLGHLNQTSLLWKDIKIRGVISNGVESKVIS